jgi:hypothetical protein
MRIFTGLPKAVDDDIYQRLRMSGRTPRISQVKEYKALANPSVKYILQYQIMTIQAFLHHNWPVS